MCGVRVQNLEYERVGAWAIPLRSGRVTFDVRLKEKDSGRRKVARTCGTVGLCGGSLGV